MTARRRSRLLPLLFVVLVIGVPVLEVWLLIQVGQLIGVLPTVAVLVAEAVLGAWLMRREGGRAYRALNEAFGTGRMPTRELSDAALVLVGGVLLVLPGFATDIIGLFCLLPLTRPLARRLLGWLVARRLARLGGALVPTFGSATVIEGETVETPTRPGPETIRGEIDEPQR